MLDVQSLASGVIQEINPDYPLVIQLSTGSTTNADGTRTPSYTTIKGARGNVQALTFRDLAQINGLNLGGVRKAIYVRGELDNVVRSELAGGDLITTPDGNVWLVAQVLEQWPDWCKVAATLQNGS